MNALGHAHPAVVAAVTAQIQQLGHVSNFFVHEPVLRLAERLQGLLEAPDSARAVLQLRRRGQRGRVQDVPAHRVAAPRSSRHEGGFHGRTMGALALTGQPAKREPFTPLPETVR